MLNLGKLYKAHGAKLNMKLTRKEIEYLEGNTNRCDICGHLEVLHTYHCCNFCNVDSCPCYNGEGAEIYKKEEVLYTFIQSNEENTH